MKNLIQSILHAHLVPPCPHGNLVGLSGRKWLARQILPVDEHAAIERHLGLIRRINEALTVVEAGIAVHALQDPTIRRLMTLPGLDVTVASGVAAAIGDISRFSDPQKLVGYLGLNRSVQRRGNVTPSFKSLAAWSKATAAALMLLYWSPPFARIWTFLRAACTL